MCSWRWFIPSLLDALPVMLAVAPVFSALLWRMAFSLVPCDGRLHDLRGWNAAIALRYLCRMLFGSRRPVWMKANPERGSLLLTTLGPLVSVTKVAGPLSFRRTTRLQGQVHRAGHL
jgi:hypothetical protein